MADFICVADLADCIHHFMWCAAFFIKQVKNGGLVTSGVEADDNGHLIYNDGQILQNRCLYSFSSVFLCY